MEEKVITVTLKEGQTITDWVRETLKSKLSKRYKIVHLAEDAGIDKFQVYRFMYGKEVTGKFYDKIFKYLTETKNE